MTQPRCIRPGRTWFVTRRTTRRHYLLRPDRDGTMQKIYWYVTAVIAQKFGVELHAVQVLSTHIHEVLTDVRGLLPAFLRERNRLLANALKCHRAWPEEVFQRAPASCVELYGANAVAKQISYTLANCVEAGLVRSPDDWPGITVRIDEIGSRVVEVERPDVYFDPRNPAWPQVAKVPITMPALMTQAHGARALDVLRSVTQAAVEHARDLAQKARRVAKATRDHLFTVPFTKRSSSYEPLGVRNPTFATAGDREQLKQALDDTRTFRARYRAALEDLKKNLPSVVFPQGAWRWVRELLPGRSSVVAP